jgi:uncharacterized membrane protein
MKGHIMGNSGLEAMAGLLTAFGFFMVFLLVVAFLIIQYLSLLGDLRATPPHVLPPHVLRRSVVLVLTALVLSSLMNLFPESNRDRYTLPSFLANILVFAVILGLIIAAWIWWEMRRKIVRNRPS